LLCSFLSLTSVGKQIPSFFPFSAVFSPFGRKLLVYQYYYFAYRVQGGTPCRRGTGGAEPPASFFLIRSHDFALAG
ncbi:MAG: hypothetical protein IJ968_01040, partial [Clostridia bacterium]|nr:hypothetical protein [Clostridia bacterium]